MDRTRYRRGVIDETDQYALDDETAEADAREATVWIEGLDRSSVDAGTASACASTCRPRRSTSRAATTKSASLSPGSCPTSACWRRSKRDWSRCRSFRPRMDRARRCRAIFNVWRWVQRQAQDDGHIGPVTVTEVMRYATAPIVTLAASWRETFAVWKKHFDEGKRQHDVPPVFIIVCKDTTVAKAMHAWLAEGDKQYGAGIPEFRNATGREMTIRIDSKVGEDIAAGGSQDETRRLRFVLEPIGRTEWPGRKVPEEYAALVERNNRKALGDEDADGDAVALNPDVPPGRDVRCIISVSMLSDPVELHYTWRPQLRDPKDEMVLETALNGRSEALVTFNEADFAKAARKLGMPLWNPRDLLRRLETTR